MSLLPFPMNLAFTLRAWLLGPSPCQSFRDLLGYWISVSPGREQPNIFWVRDESLKESDNLPEPDVLAQEIVDDLEPSSNNSAKSPPMWSKRKRAGGA